jgi:predicted RNA binding protein YcfA (HicA-like mRNA interferase family)
LARGGWPNVAFAFHDNEEIGPKMLARIAKQTGLKPEDL